MKYDIISENPLMTEGYEIMNNLAPGIMHSLFDKENVPYKLLYMHGFETERNRKETLSFLAPQLQPQLLSKIQQML